MTSLSVRPASIHVLKLIVIALSSVSWMLSNVSQAHACTCLPISPSDMDEHFSVVFAGKAIDERTRYHPQSANPLSEVTGEYRYVTIYTLLVHTVWKGPSYEIVYMQSYSDILSTCGGGGPGHFAIGHEYLVYTGPRMTVYSCNGVHSLASAQEYLDELGAGQPPEPGTVAPGRESMDNWCSEGEVKLARSNGMRLRSDTKGCVAVSESASAADGEESGPPQWMLPTLAGVSGIYVGVLATTLLLRRRSGGT